MVSCWHGSIFHSAANRGGEVAWCCYSDSAHEEEQGFLPEHFDVRSAGNREDDVCQGWLASLYPSTPPIVTVSGWCEKCHYFRFVSLFPFSVSFVSLWALGFPTTYDLSVFSPSLCLLYHCEHLAFLLHMICQSFPLLCVFCIIVSTWLSYYLWFVSPFPFSVSFVSLWALGFPTTYDLSVFSPPLCLLYHCEHLAFLLPMICQSFPRLCVFCIIVSTWLSYYLWFVSLFPFSVSFVSLWALGFPTTYDLSVFSPPLCLLYHCEHLAFLLPMICQSFPLLCVFCIIVSTWLSYYLWFVSLFPLLCVFCIIVSTWLSYYLWFVSPFRSPVSFVSLWALGFPTTYDLSVFSPPLCLLYHCEHLAFLLPMICQSFPLLCVFCIIVSTWLSYYLWFVSLFPSSVSFVSLWALGFPTTYNLSVFSPSLCLLYHCEHLAFLILIICQSFPLLCVFCIIVSTWLSYYLWFVSLFPFSMSFVSLRALGFPTTYDLSVLSAPLCLLYHCEHLAFLLPMICQSFPLLCVFCIIVSTWLSYYLWFVSPFRSSVSFVSLWALGFPTTYDLSVLSAPLCLLYHCEHLAFLLPMICQSFPLLCVFCIIVSTWLSYYLWFVCLFPFSVSFVSLWALGFPTTYDLSVLSAPLCLLYHCEHLAFLLPMICQSFPLLCVFCIIVSTWLSYYLWFVSLFPSSVSFVSLWALGFPTTYDLSVFSPPLCLLYHCEHLAFLLLMICQSFPLLCVFCIIVSTWLSYYLWFVCLFPFSVSFVSLWALGFPTTYDLSVFSPSLCLLYHCEHLAFLLPMICQSFPLLCVFCIIVSTWLSYYLWFVSVFPFSVSFVSLWALGFPTTYDLSVFSPSLCLLYHCEHLAFLLPMICQSFPLLCVFCIIVSTWLSYYLWFVSLFPFSVSFVSLWALGFPTTYDLSVFSPSLCLLYHWEHLTFLLPMICQSFPLLCVFCIIVSTWLSYYLWFVSPFRSPVSFVSLWALGFPTTYDLSVFSPPLCLLYHCEHLAFLLPMICQSFPLLCVFCIIVSTWLSYYLWFVSLFPSSVSFVSLWALGFPTTYNLSVFSPSLCLLYHSEHLAFLILIICQSFPLLCVFCIIVSTWLSYYL